MLIDSIENKKHKSLISLAYSCGLEIQEILNLKVKDVKSKEKLLFVRTEEGDLKRKAHLSSTVINTLQEYWRSFPTDNKPKPTDYFFEGQKGDKYSIRSLQQVFKKAVLENGLNPKLSLRNVRQTYIAHMISLGAPLITLLDELDIRAWESHRRYTKYIYGDFKLDFSPMDRSVVEFEEIEKEFRDIENLIFKIKDEDERAYLKEALACLRVGSTRASVIMIWNACIQQVRKKCMKINDLKRLNEELKKVAGKTKEIKKEDDFEHVSDRNTIELAAQLRIFSKHEKLMLIDSCLSLRNKCGHPSKYHPKPNKVKAFVEDAINIIFD